MTRTARVSTIAALCLMAPIGALCAQGDARPAVAVVMFNNNVATKDVRDYDGLNKALADFLGTELAANAGIRVVDRDQVQKLVDGQVLGAGGFVGRETAVRVGKALGVPHVIFGGFMADPRGNVRIDARAVNVEQGAIEYTERLQSKSDNVMELVGILAIRMNAGMGLPAFQSAAHGTQLPMKQAIRYGRALDMMDRGQKAQAAEILDAVLKDFPDFEPAKKVKARLASGG
jgi:TolB-like protein